MPLGANIMYVLAYFTAFNYLCTADYLNVYQLRPRKEPSFHLPHPRRLLLNPTQLNMPTTAMVLVLL
jgi:hypothetical protein